ncbi:hypothetical protein F8M41_010618 [Gigaspora margarita]|uniref:Uncharacterized protein n=1 Tax=Gigaspora margarita TaxID=4874 RepID=A0A8H4AU84_GIGMA|nr:hypothetical protein F8M41_010618 [Gigaspora margarita]
MENENKNEIVSSEIEKNSSSSVNFEFNNHISEFTNFGMPNSGSVGCRLTNLVDLEFSGSVLSSNSADVSPSASSSGFQDILPGAISSGFQDILPSAISSGFQDISSGFCFTGTKSSGFKDVLSDAISFRFQDILSGAISFGSQDVSFSVVSSESDITGIEKFLPTSTTDDISTELTLHVENFFNNWNAIQCAID